MYKHVQKKTHSGSGAVWKEADGLRIHANPSALALGISSDVQHVQKKTRSGSGAIRKEADGLRSDANPSALALGIRFRHRSERSRWIKEYC